MYPLSNLRIVGGGVSVTPVSNSGVTSLMGKGVMERVRNRGVIR